MTAASAPATARDRARRWLPICREELAAARHRAGLNALARTHQRITKETTR